MQRTQDARWRQGRLGRTTLLTTVALVATVLASGLTGPVRAPEARAAATQAGMYTPVSPTRILDTRSGVGAPRAAVPAQSALPVQVAGVGGVPSTVSAVVLTVTVASPAASGYVAAYADGTTRPTVSNVNFVANTDASNLVVAQVGANGKVDLFNGSAGSVALIADVSGFFVAGTPSAPGAFAAVTPARLLDTRTGTGGVTGALAPNGGVAVQVAGVAGVPSNAAAVVLNVTASDPSAAGWVSAFADGTAQPGISNLNFVRGETVAKVAVAGVGAGGKVRLHNGSAGTVNLVADIAGYYLPGSGGGEGSFVPVAPTRMADTRIGVGTTRAPVPGGGSLSVQLAGVNGLPTALSAVVVNLTATNPTSAGYVSAFADGDPMPPVSSVNFTANRTVPNLVVAQVGANGKVRLYNGSAGTVDLIVDVMGYVTPPPTAAAGLADDPRTLTPITPTRVLDSRTGTGGVNGALPAASSVAIPVAGVSGIPGDVASVVVNVTVTVPATQGFVSVWADGTDQPNVSAVNFAAGQTIANLAVTRVGADGKIRVFNGAAGAVHVIADVTGYYSSTRTYSGGGYVALVPKRIADTRSGVGGVSGPVAANSGVPVQVSGIGGVPASASAVVLNLTATQPTAVGWASAFADGAPVPSVSNLNFSPGSTVANLVVAQVGADGKVQVYNGSPGTTHFVVDVAGYYTGGATTATGAFVPVTPSRVADTRTGLAGVSSPVSSQDGISVIVANRSGVPASVGAVVVNVTVTAPGKAGWVSAFADNTDLPTASNVNFAANSTVPNLVVAQVGADGKIRVHNGSAGTAHLIVDVMGYITGSPVAATNTNRTAPLISTSRYPRNLYGTSADRTTMYNAGRADAQANPDGHPYLILLDIGGQDQSGGGVVLTATSLWLSYSSLVADLNAYVDGFVSGQASNAPTLIVLGTNNDMDVNQQTGADWARLVVNPVAGYAARYANVTIGGANDMEPGFSATVGATRSWLTGFLGATNAVFVFNGSADGCSTTGPGSGCNHGWTEGDLQWLSGGAAPGRIISLPQIYYVSMSKQWKWISLTGVNAGLPALQFAGPLTEWTACSQAGWWCGSMTGNDAWAQMWSDLVSDDRTAQTHLPDSTDLRIN